MPGPHCSTSSSTLRLRVGALLLVRLALVAIALTPTGNAQRAAASEPERVEVGVWMNSIHTIDFQDGSFGAEFYLWWISPDEDFRPFEALQILNGRQWTTRGIYKRQLPDGRYHTSGYVSVTINHDWELLKYPFDRQTLQIIIETPYTSSEVRLAPDAEQSTLSEFLEIQGYTVSDLTVTERVNQYNSDFGLGDEAGTRFSRFVVSMDADRESGRLVLAMLIGFFASNLIVLLTYTVQIKMLAVRGTMIASAIFCAVGNMNLLNGQLNPAVGSLLVDRFALGSFCMIVIALANSILVDRLAVREHSTIAHRVNRIVFFVTAPLSIGFYALSFVAATS